MVVLYDSNKEGRHDILIQLTSWTLHGRTPDARNRPPENQSTASISSAQYDKPESATADDWSRRSYEADVRILLQRQRNAEECKAPITLLGGDSTGRLIGPSRGPEVATGAETTPCSWSFVFPCMGSVAHLHVRQPLLWEATWQLPEHCFLLVAKERSEVEGGHVPKRGHWSLARRSWKMEKDGLDQDV